MIFFISEKDFKETEKIKKASVQDCLEYFLDKEEIQLDTETGGLSHTSSLLCFQLGDQDGENQFVIDCETISVLDFKELLESKTFILHNAKFDLRFFYVKGIIIKKVYDTFLGEALLYLGDSFTSKSLKALAIKYLGIDLDKSIRGHIHYKGLHEDVIEYAANDVKYLSDIKKLQYQKIKEQELEKALELENSFVIVLAYIEFCGFKLDNTKWQLKIDQDLIHLENCLKDLNNYIIDNNIKEYINYQLNFFNEEITVNINWSSPSQIVKFFNKLGINTIDKEGKNSVEATVLKSQEKKFSIIPLYLNFKKAEKVVSTYGESFLLQINEYTNRIHTNFNQLMDTTRLSSGGKDKTNKVDYINFQNIPAVPEFKLPNKIYERECFVPEEGNIFVVSDFDGQEARIFANKCLDKNLLDFYDFGYGDQHSYVAKLCYPEVLKDVPLEDVKKVRKDLRQNAKFAGFALQYGGVGATIASSLNISLEEGNAVEEAYYKAFPGIKKYFDDVSKQAIKTGEIIFNTVTKHKYKFHFWSKFKEIEGQIKEQGFWTDYKQHKSENSEEFISFYKPLVKDYFYYKGIIERTAKNFPIQGSGAAITKLACIYIFKYLIQKNLVFKVLIPNVIHDEILVECPKELATDLSEVVKSSMEKAGLVFCKRVPLTATPHIGDSWEH